MHTCWYAQAHVCVRTYRVFVKLWQSNDFNLCCSVNWMLLLFLSFFLFLSCVSLLFFHASLLFFITVCNRTMSRIKCTTYIPFNFLYSSVVLFFFVFFFVFTHQRLYLFVFCCASNRLGEEMYAIYDDTCTGIPYRLVKCIWWSVTMHNACDFQPDRVSGQHFITEWLKVTKKKSKRGNEQKTKHFISVPDTKLLNQMVNTDYSRRTMSIAKLIV